MKNMLPKKLQRTNVIIVAHIYATGPALDLEQYLKEKVKTLVFIGHPFAYTKSNQSFFRKWENGKNIKEGKSISLTFPSILLYFKELFFTFLWTIQNKQENSIYIGSDNYSTFLGLLLKKMGIVGKVILYTIDYVPKRFGNPVLNFLYHYFDKQCLTHCDIVWNVSDKIAIAREETGGISRKNSRPQITVPLGMWYQRIPKVPFHKRKKHSVIFMGHILEKQGLDIVIKSLPRVIKKVPTVSLTVVGSGPHENQLKKLVKTLKLQNHVHFLGYVEKHEDVEKELANATIAVATYKPDPESFTYFADPGKIKNYLGAGLPILITQVPAVAVEIEKRKCGIICEFDERDIAEKMIDLLTHKSKLMTFSKNAYTFAKQFDWEIVFDKALTTSLT